MNAQDEELEPLSDLATSAFSAERARAVRGGSAARDAELERILGRVLVTVGAGAATTAALAAASGTAKAAATVGGTTAAGASAASAATSALSVKVVVGVAALAFAAGTGTGVVIQRAATPPAVPVAPAPSVTAPAPEPTLIANSRSITPTASASDSAIPTAPPALPTSLSVPPPTAAPSGTAADADLAAERSLIDRARSALARGDVPACLDATSAHAKRFPAGRLGEERELIAIQALAKDGQIAVARARANRFRKSYPKSMFLPAVDRIVPPQE